MNMYQIGQILFLLSKKEIKIIPVQVIEEITRKALTGNSLDYIIKVNSTSTLEMSKILDDYIIFESSESLESHMFNEAKNSISIMIKKIIDNANKQFNNEKEKVQNQLENIKHAELSNSNQ